MKNIAIVGCGYIGSAAAAIWSKQGRHVTATTRSPERLDDLAKVSQKSLILRGNDKDEFVPLIANNEVILITIAADSSEHYESAYLNTAKIFRHLALGMNMPRILIYTGSTSVYGDHHGLWVDETSELRPVTAAAKILADAEKTYLSLDQLGWSVCVLRFAEIYGPGRELSKRIKQFKDQILPGSGDHYTNMVHKEDCAASIEYALSHNLEGIFNIADDDHPPRRELYDLVARKFHLPPVKWDPALSSLHSGNKRVSNHKIKSEGFALFHPKRILD
jgi:nucleoside-diphosphate-sugar epimerase